MENQAEKPRRKRRTREEIEADELEEFKGNSKGYYAKNYPPEYYTCIEHSRDNLRGPGKLDEKHVMEYVGKALEVGIEEYTWHTRKDGHVCPRCASYEGKTFRYDTVPPGGHPGLAAGCRCFAEPMIDIKNLGKKKRAVKSNSPTASSTPLPWKRLLKMTLIALSLVVLYKIITS